MQRNTHSKEDGQTRQVDLRTQNGNGWKTEGKAIGRRREVDEIFLECGREADWSVIKLLVFQNCFWFCQQVTYSVTITL